MDIYKHKIMLVMASAAISSCSKSELAKPSIQVMRLCDCTNCRMGKIDKCTTYKPSKKGKR